MPQEPAVGGRAPEKRRIAAHVQAAIGPSLQAKTAGATKSGTPAAHVQRTVRSPAPTHPPAQGKALPTRSPAQPMQLPNAPRRLMPGTLQRATALDQTVGCGDDVGRAFALIARKILIDCARMPLTVINVLAEEEAKEAADVPEEYGKSLNANAVRFAEILREGLNANNRLLDRLIKDRVSHTVGTFGEDLTAIAQHIGKPSFLGWKAITNLLRIVKTGEGRQGQI